MRITITAPDLGCVEFATHALNEFIKGRGNEFPNPAAAISNTSFVAECTEKPSGNYSVRCRRIPKEAAMPAGFSTQHLELMQHALGIDGRSRVPWRNYFLTNTDCRDNTEWLELVAGGYATSHPAPPGFCGDVVYQVTDKGRDLAISALPIP